MAANAAGDASTGSSAVTATIQQTLSSSEVSGPMGDAPQKRPLEDGEEPGPKKLAALSDSSANFSTSATIGTPLTVDTSLDMQGQSGVMSESMRLPDDLVGLIIGRGGENIMRMQRETGCRIQITQSIPGTKERPCTLSGTPEQIEVCRNMLNEIISRSQAGTLGSNFNLNSNNPITGDSMATSMEKSVEISIPSDKCGLIIGKKGETIKALQENLGVKMLLVQHTTENTGAAKPLRISGTQANIDNAVNAIHQMMAQRDLQIAQQKMDPSIGGQEENTIPVPKAAVGVVIGKHGDMINQIQNVTGTRIQFKPEEPNLPDRICTVMGSKEGCNAALARVHEIIQNVAERDGMSMGGGSGSGRGGGGMGQQGGMGGFGQWEGPNRNNRGGMGAVTTESHLVPANKTGLVIGKGGDTIKQINMQSGAHAEIVRNPPPGSDLNYKTFIIKGTPEQIKLCRQLIQEKVDTRVGGGMPNGSLGGPPGQVPPPGNYGPPPQQGGYGGLPPAASYAPPQQSALQPPTQTQPAQSLQQQQQWGTQFPQWNPPSATTPQQNGADPGKPATDASNAAWQSYLQLYAPQAAAAAASAAAVPTQPDYSKQWDEYLKRTGAAAVATPAVAPAAAAAPALQQPLTATATAAQPATTQADYSAAWAEYYRQYYQQVQEQQYAAAAAAAGQAPAQT
ncbi:far upstream element-binding protein 1-like isoform X3 [Clavelina lepadiformis]|uniref:far upstream element-binding protein 1-like isoform X3 n=1 Tax=Clavelina lepadiformis TaxID=159417 RepID=UPI004042E413